MSFKVKALFAYSSEHDDDLNFPEGQIITVTEEEDDDWYNGVYVDDATGAQHQGLFPRNFVERYEPVAPPRPARRPQAAAPAPAPAPEAVLESQPEPEAKPAPTLTSPVTRHVTDAQHEDQEEEEAEEEEAEEEETEPQESHRLNQEREEAAVPPPVLATKPPPPPREERQEMSPPVARAVPPPLAPAEASGRDSKADNSDKYIGSFKDRIAAFNRGGAAPLAPPKPGGLGGGSGPSGFIKKSYVAPPPSRNVYVPPTAQAPVAKIYRREEDPELKAQDEGERAAPPPPEKTVEPEEDQPKPMSLKERMALLQKQQLEQQAKHAEAAAKKPKPKPPPKKSSSSSQPPVPGAIAEGAGGIAELPAPTRVLSQDSAKDNTIASPEHEIDEPSYAPEAPSEPSVRSPPPPPVAEEPRRAVVPESDANEGEEAANEDEGEKDEQEGEEEAEGEEEDEEMDPEIKRRMEIRERMAKMSGGMGMGAMFGAGPGLPGMGARKPSKPKPSEQHAAIDEAANEPAAQPIPIMPAMGMPGMALPGMGLPRRKQEELVTKDGENEHDEEDEGTVNVDTAHASEESEDNERTATEPERAIPPPESRPAPPVPPTADRPKRASMASTKSPTADRSAPPIPQRAPEHASPQAPSRQMSSPPATPSVPTRRSTDTKRQSTSDEPQPRVSASYSRGPPPPPPTQPPRKSLEVAQDESSEDEEEANESDDDQEHMGTHTGDDLHHAGLPSLGPEAQTRAPPPVPSATGSAPRGAPPPPPPGQPPRQSREMPRAPPPIPPPAISPPANDDDYDPYNYEANPMGAPTPTGNAFATTTHVEVQPNDLYDSSAPSSPVMRGPPPLPAQPPPMAAAPPLPPPSQPPPSQAAPPPPPPQAAPIQAAPQPPAQVAPQMPPTAPPASVQESRKSLDVLGRTQTRRSVDVPRPSGESHDYMASDVDLGRDSNWWAQRRSPPPIFQGRNDVSIEYDESNTVQSDGRALTAKRVYVLFMDYSQTIITAYFSQDNPSSGAELQQRHEPPPAQLRQDQLEAAHSQFGARLAQAAKGKENHAVADGSALSFVNELIKSTAGALMPVGNRAFGATVYANMANATVQQHDEIRAGDVLSFRNAKLQGHRGGLKQKYAQELPAHFGFVLDWDGTKQKVRIYEQNGKKVKVESYKLGDLKTGEAKIWRVVSREWVGWGSGS